MDFEISGLVYIPDYLSNQEQIDLLQNIDQMPWLNDLKRRVQHYGYKYDYTARNIDSSMKIEPLPEFTANLCKRFVVDNLISQAPDQLIINEYLPGQGIAPHIDCVPCFDDTILSISLNDVYTMQFYDVDSDMVQELELGLGSLLLLKGKSRYNWRHGIKGSKKKGRRVSMTFRNVILNNV